MGQVLTTSFVPHETDATMKALHDAIETKDEIRALATLSVTWGRRGWDSHTDDEGRTSLHAAASAGMERLVCALIGKGADVNARGKHSETPLMCAAEKGMVGTMAVLVAMDGDVEADSRHGMRALHHALCFKQEAAALFLIKRDPPCNVDAPDEDGRTPLMYAASNGMVEVMNALVAKDANVEAMKRKDGMRALHRALHSQQEAAALFLIRRNPPCDVNAPDRYGKTPLMYAAESGMVDVMEALIAKSVNVEAADSVFQMRALHHALHNKQEAAALFLIQRDPPCDVNAADIHDKTPLMYAASNGMVEVMKALVAKDADMEGKDNGLGQRALHMAVNWKQEAAALFLIRRNPPCEVDAPDTNGKTPFMYAASGGVVGVMEALVAKKVDIEVADNHGKQALHHALGLKKEAAALFLIRRDPPCNVNAPDEDGKTPLMYAAERGMLVVLKALVAKDVDTEVADKRGKRALDHASERKQEAAALFLKQCADGANEEAVRLEADCPDEFLDPISRHLLHDPVVAMDGETYSRTLIQEYIDRRASGRLPLFSPLHGAVMEPRLVPNIMARKLIADYVEKKKREWAFELVKSGNVDHSHTNSQP